MKRPRLDSQKEFLVYSKLKDDTARESVAQPDLPPDELLCWYRSKFNELFDLLWRDWVYTVVLPTGEDSVCPSVCVDELFKQLPELARQLRRISPQTNLLPIARLLDARALAWETLPEVNPEYDHHEHVYSRISNEWFKVRKHWMLMEFEAAGKVSTEDGKTKESRAVNSEPGVSKTDQPGYVSDTNVEPIPELKLNSGEWVTPEQTSSPDALSNKQNEILQAVREARAATQDARITAKEIAKRVANNTDTNLFKKALAQLVKRGHLNSKAGRGGGYWLALETD